MKKGVIYNNESLKFKRNLTNLEKSSVDVGKTIIMYGQGYDRVRNDEDSKSKRFIYITKEEFQKQKNPSIEIHHPAVCPTLTCLKKNILKAKSTNPVTCPHPDMYNPENKVSVGYVIDIRISNENAKNRDKYSSYLSLFYYMRIHIQMLSYILSYLDVNLEKLSTYHKRIYKNIIFNKKSIEKFNENELKAVKDIIYNFGELSIGYRYEIKEINQSGKPMILVYNFELDHIAIVNNARYKKSIPMFINEKKINTTLNLFLTNSIKMEGEKKEAVINNEKKKETKDKDVEMKDKKKDEIKDEVKVDVPKSSSPEYNRKKVIFAINSKYGMPIDNHMDLIEKTPALKGIFGSMSERIINDMKKDFENKEIEYNKEIKELNKSYTIYNGSEKSKIEGVLQEQLKKIKFHNELKDAWKFIVCNAKKLNEMHDLKFNEQKRPNKDILGKTEEEPLLKKSKTVVTFNEKSSTTLDYDDPKLDKIKNLIKTTWMKSLNDESAFLYNCKKK